MTHHRISLFAAYLLAIAFLTAPAFSQERPFSSTVTTSVIQPPPVPILGTQLLTIHSAIVGRDYDLYINLPRHFNDTTRSFPVLYVLDAQWDFPLVNAVFGEQYYDGFVPGIVTVGITWGGTNPNYDSLRARDLTPTNVKGNPSSGNAPKFLDFIKKELIPYIDTRFRTVSNDRALMGSSLGGLFTLYAMFHETALFDRYVLTSPALGWDNGILATYEKEYAAKNTRLPGKLFMAMGSYEGGVAEFQKFVNGLKARNYQDLDLQSKIIEGIGHSGTKAEGYTRGLQSVYGRPSLAVAPALLKAYAGKYRLNPEVQFGISQEDNRLVLMAPDSSRIPLFAQTDRDFYAKGMYLFIQFQKTDEGKITGAHVELYQGEMQLTKIE